MLDQQESPWAVPDTLIDDPVAVTVTCSVDVDLGNVMPLVCPDAPDQVATWAPVSSVILTVAGSGEKLTVTTTSWQ